MKHFGLEEWVDFSRDVIPEKRKQAMQQHLETGLRRLRKCRSNLETRPPDGTRRFQL